MFRRAQAPAGWRAMAMALATLAIALRILLPAGFMLQTSGRDLPGLVICTGQGAMTLAADGTLQSDTEDGSAANTETHPCAFSSAVVGFTAPLAVGVALSLPLSSPVTAPRLMTQRPGLGLAAPPPPTTGPPIQI